MSEFRQRGSFESYHTQLKQINEQRRKKQQNESSSSPLFSIEDIPFGGPFDRRVAKPPPSQLRQQQQQRNTTSRSSSWSTQLATNPRNDYSQRSVQQGRPVLSVGFDSRDPPRNLRGIPLPQQDQPQQMQQQPQQNRTRDGWPDPQPSWRPSRATHQPQPQPQQQQQQPTTPPEQPSPTRVKMIQPDRFQQWQSEAAQLWINGIDINMEEKPRNVKKKKAGWLTMEEFASYSTTAHNNNDNNSSSTSAQRSQSSFSRPHQEQQQQQHRPSPSPIPAAPAPAPTPSPVTVHTPMNPSTSTSRSTSLAPPPPPPRAATVPTSKLISNLHSPAGRLLFLDAIDSGAISPKSLLTTLPTLLNHSLDNRCVDKLLTIVVRRAASNDHHQSQLLQFIESTPNLLLLRYLPFHVCLPRDMTLVLDFLQALFTHCPGAMISWSDVFKKLQQHYTDHLKPLYPPSTTATIDDQLQKLDNLQSNALGGWGGWDVSDQQAEKDDAPKRYLKEQLARHEKQLASIGNHATQLVTTTATTSSSNTHWVIFKHVHWYRRSSVLSPAIPAPAHVYLTCTSSAHRLDRSYIGCVAILIDPHTTSTPPLFGTTIEYAHQNDQYLVAVYHSTTSNAPLMAQHPYDLILTTIPATSLLALTDWLRTATASDINPSLATLVPLWPPSSSAKQLNGVPDYLDKLSLDVSTIMAPNYHGCKANISENTWPVLQAKHRRLPVSQRPPLYTLSDSQVRALQYALSHRLAFVDGSTGSGKTHVASKCLNLLVSQVLQQHWLRRPILVLCDSVAALTDLVTKAGVRQETVLFGDSTTQQHLMTLDNLPRGSPEWKQHRYHSRDLEVWVTRLQLLQAHQHAVVDKQRAQYVADLMPPSYRQALYDGADGIGNGGLWLDVQEDYHESTDTSAQLMEAILTQQEMTPLMAPEELAQQQAWMRDHPITLVSLLEDDREWPFAHMDDDGKTRRGDRARYALMKIWSQVAPEALWQLSVDARRELYAQVVAAYDTELTHVMAMIQARQTKALAALHQLRVAHWRKLCTFRRVVAMTTPFAMVHVSSLVRAIDPMVVILDTNQPQSGAMLAALALGPETQHVMVFGQGHGQGERLEEQWRMVPSVWKLWKVATSAPQQDSGLCLATLPKSSTTGVNDPTYCVALDQYQASDMVAWLAQLVCYIYQQEIAHQKLVVLLTSSGSVGALMQVLQALQQQRAMFLTGLLETVAVTSVAAYQGGEMDTVVLGVMDDGRMPTDAQLSMALSRPKSALYVVGARATFEKHELWLRVLNYMEKQGRCMNSIPLICKNHPGTETMVQQIDDFAKVENGGCNVICRTTMECGHTCQEKCHHRSHQAAKCRQPCERTRQPGCTHPCASLCHECTYGCSPCSALVPLHLACGHSVSVACYQQQETHVCPEIVTTDLPCGHTVSGHCGDLPICTSPCAAFLECGHPCQRLCGEEHEHDRSSCTFECPKTLICGHHCANGCAKPDDHTERCLQNCARQCFHGYKCGRPCWKVCVKCISPCPHQCPHSQCTKRCSEPCDRVPCNEPCPELLPCLHPCRGLCGEPCSKCVICEPNIRCPITLRTISEFTEDERIYTLPECGCSFTLDSLDQYFSSRVKSGEHTAIKQWVCPSCQTPVLTAGRYAEHIKAEFDLIDTIKAQQEKLTDEERLHIVNAMNEEPNNHANDIVGGRWFVCNNRHPYFIGDCGGATEVSTCPECNETIGGQQHQVVDTNQFYGEFDGSTQPAWPGQPGV